MAETGWVPMNNSTPHTRMCRSCSSQGDFLRDQKELQRKEKQAGASIITQASHSELRHRRKQQQGPKLLLSQHQSHSENIFYLLRIYYPSTFIKNLRTATIANVFFFSLPLFASSRNPGYLLVSDQYRLKKVFDL